MQDDLFPRPAFSMTPESGRTEPRLWVRRLLIWREPGAIIRGIELKPGLNIVWSPDPGALEAGPIGHGGGKTMFCRLLRYCLGEDGFAPEGQRHRIWDKLPHGRVGAEIILDGQIWVIVRALGGRRHDVVILGGTLEEAVREGIAPTGIGTLRDAIAQRIIGDAAKLIPRTIGESAAWEAALAWMTRDQECRFGHHLEWRDPHTDSRSPVRGRSMEDRLAVVRALTGALTAAEIETQKQEDEEGKREKAFQAELAQLNWHTDRTRTNLSSALGSVTASASGFGIDVMHFRNAAAARYAEILKLPVASIATDLERARGDRDNLAEELRRLETALTEIAVRIEEKNKSLSYIRGELPTARARLTKENNPVCPICEVPIDKALAEGCGISTVTCDLGALQTRIARLKADVDREQDEINSLRVREPSLQTEVALARQRLRPLEQAVAALERTLLDQSKSIRAAQRLVEEAERYDALLAERTELAASIEQATGRLGATRETLAAHRAGAGESIRRLSATFDAVLRELVLGDIKGEAKLDGNGLTLKVELAGERSTAAIESLKVVAFDLAILAMTIEGQTRLPGLLVHDSPREADLGRSIYDRLFGFAKRLEGFGPGPLFQYIVTTTTEPPGEFHSEPWLRLMVRGAPAEERLLRVDL
jgi:hypothetical protein